jgi:hypothetical protein
MLPLYSAASRHLLSAALTLIPDLDVLADVIAYGNPNGF